MIPFLVAVLSAVPAWAGPPPRFHAAPAPGLTRPLPPPPPPSSPRPYKILVLTDGAAATERARAFERLVRGTEPFSRMGAQLEIEISQVTPESLACRTGCQPKVPRLVCCDRDAAARVGAERLAHRTAIITGTGRGGSGGPVPVATVSYPVETLLHELGHSYGLQDEYEYSADERAMYCTKGGARGGPNVVAIRPRAEYESDQAAREIHGGQIPWYGEITAERLITTGSQLGTTPALYPVDAAALYRGGNCDRITPTWRPYYGANIMRSFGAPNFPAIHQRAILKSMSAELGRTIRLVPRSDCPTCR